MTDQPLGNTPAPLQFDRLTDDGSGVHLGGGTAVTCESCRTSIGTEYYDVNGHTVCARCRDAVAAVGQTPTGMGPLAIAAAFGLGAGIAGAAVYYAVLAFLHLEIGIVAILIGYMVGYAVRKGAGGRGGRRFQVLAVALTYASIALAYAPIAFKQVFDEANRQPRQEQVASAGNAGTGAPVTATQERQPAPQGSFLMALALLAGFTLALPILVVIGSLPSSLISALIMSFGLHQAWKMTAAPMLMISGPYRVGAGRSAAATP